VTLQEITDALAREPMRNIVLLKQLLAYRGHVTAHRIGGPRGVATLVILDTSVSSYDRQAYPGAAVAVFLDSDHPDLTARLLPRVPRGGGVVFKLSREADLAPVAAQFSVERRTAFISFSSAVPTVADAGVRITSAPGDGAFALFETQGHERTWLEPLLATGNAFACVLEQDGETVSVCFAFENHGPVWEVGGVVTAPGHRRKGLGARVVRTALAELSRRGLAPRYQVEEHNAASIHLAHSVGLSPFLTITHYAHGC
jgi:GNAT superfamily N-acetyltransferase